MRERPKHPSYLERHRQADDNEHKNGGKSESRRSLSNQPANLSSLPMPTTLPKKSDKGMTSNASRVRVGASSKATDKSAGSSTSVSGGYMTQFRSLDDIPDGLPESPQKGGSIYGVSAAKTYDGDYDDDDECQEKWNSSYVAAPINHSSRQPMFPSERAALNESNLGGKSESRPDSSRLREHLSLQGDVEGKNRPIIYPTSHSRSVQQSNLSDDEDDNWDNDSEDDSQPTRKPMNKNSGLNPEDGPVKGRYDGKSSGTQQTASTSRKIGAPLKLPPELPFEAMQEKADVKDQLYFSKQPRQIDYT